ncbi:hypothetical protein NITMOv2_4250 [Nitrospira moscoviensis]|uniref:Uncharacterized protein n=1 Tax=Nitrospira moscoviensis TaxID=42253 RepID=A0A0K2GI31_NITMO|nr:hypothetical protein NITMOv2_4250 [Nitrospira moscoviensis]
MPARVETFFPLWNPYPVKTELMRFVSPLCDPLRLSGREQLDTNRDAKYTANKLCRSVGKAVTSIRDT